MRRILTYQFFNRPTLKVAEKLLGKFLIRRLPPTAYKRKRSKSRLNAENITAGMITEVEAYVGPYDKASHASRGRTERTKVMFGKPGHWYVYMIYGMHWCLNIVTEKEHYPAAVLIRSVAVEADKRGSKRGFTRKINGPGKVCHYLKIDKRINGKPATKATGLWIEDRGARIPKSAIKRGKRIGVEYAGKWKNKPWRFYLAEHS